MANVWITYSWDDNKHGDVDFIANELVSAGLIIKLDRWNISAGKRLWNQISDFITSPEKSDAWLLIASENSLSNEKCKEEFSYALDRALDSRGESFPIIALFVGPVDDKLIPPAIKTRLFVSIKDPDWKERIVSSAEGRAPTVTKGEVQAYKICVHESQTGSKSIAIEVRPRAGVWDPFFAAIPVVEKDRVNPNIMIGPKDIPTNSGILMMCGNGISTDGKFYYMYSGIEASPTKSYYVWCDELPSILIFGVNNGKPQYNVTLKK